LEALNVLPEENKKAGRRGWRKRVRAKEKAGPIENGLGRKRKKAAAHIG